MRFLDRVAGASYTKVMKAFLIFDFGSDEDAAQKARHRLEGWKQGFRLGDKLTLKFERESEDEAKPEEAADEKKPKTAGKKGHADSGAKGTKNVKKAAAEDAAGDAKVRVAVELSFSSHEKLSYHRWLERIPAEEPFKGVAHEVVQDADKNFEKTAEWFQGLDSGGGATARKPH